MTISRTSQLGAETFRTGETNSRTSQVGAEVFRSGETASRTSQIGAEVFIPLTSPSRTSQLGVEVFIPRPRAEFTHAGAIAGLEGPLLGIEFHHPALSDPLVIAPVALVDPVDYHYGFKQARVLRVDAVQLALSDRAGRPQANRFVFEMADFIDGDAAPIVRSWLGQVNKRALRRIEIKAWMITDQHRRELRTPVTIFRGRIDEYEGLDQYRVRIHCLSWGHQRYDKPVLTVKVGDVFPQAPAETRDRVLPLALGRLSDEGSATAAPVFVADEAGRGGTGGSAPIASYGDIGLDAPTNLALSLDAGNGNLQLGDQVNDTYYVFAVHRYTSGLGDPEPFLPDGESIQITANNDAIHAECDASVDGDYVATRFYICRQNAGGGEVLASHYIETTDPETGVDFTDVPPIGSEELGPITSGGVHAINPFAYAAVLAVMPDGRTDLAPGGGVFPNLAFIRSVGYLRPNRFALTPIALAEGYELYWKQHPTLAFARRFDIEPDALNSNGDVFWEYDWSNSGFSNVDGAPVPVGKVPPVYCGQFTDLEGFSEWGGFCMSVRPGAEFENAYMGGVKLDDHYLTTVAAPGKGGIYTTSFGADPFYTVGAYRLFMVFIRGPLLEAALQRVSESTETLPATNATATIGDADSEVLITVDQAGADGNDYTVTVEDGVGNDVPLSAVLTDTDLLITLATDSGGSPDDAANAATNVAAAINLIAGLSAGVTGSGADPVDTQAETAFGDGADEGQLPGNPYSGEFRVNFTGCDDSDDGTGSGITDIFDQFALITKHLLLADTPAVSGAWTGAMPTFADGVDRLDETALDRAKTDHDAVVSSRAAARWIADGITWGELLAEWALSASAKTAINEDGQLLVAVRNPEADPVATIEHVLEILDRSFRFRDSARGWATRTPYAYRPIYGLEGSIDEMGDRGERVASSIETEFDEAPSDTEQTYRWRDSATVARELADASLEASQLPPRTAESASVLHWLHYPIGRVLAITHPEGPAAAGYEARKVQILGKRIQPDGCTVALTLDDLRVNEGES